MVIGYDYRQMGAFALSLMLLGAASNARAQSDDVGTVRENNGEFDNDSSVISAPILEAPYECQTQVEVSGLAPGATLEISVNGNLEAQVIASSNTRFVDVPVLAVNDLVEAKQIDGSGSAATSHTTAAAPNVTTMRVLGPLYECGVGVVGDGGIPGALAELYLEPFDGTAWGAPEFRAAATVSRHGFASFPTEALSLHNNGARYKITQTFCGQAISTSPTRPVLPEPPLPTPGIISVDSSAYSTSVFLEDLVRGALIQTNLNGQFVQHDRAHGSVTAISVTGPSPGLQDGDVLSFKQSLCPGNTSNGVSTDSLEIPDPPEPGCNHPPPPRFEPPAIGDTVLRVYNVLPTSRIRVYANGVEIGDGGGRRIQLTRAVGPSDTLALVETNACGENPFYFEYAIKCDPIRVIDVTRTESGAVEFTQPVGWIDFESDDSYELTPNRSEKIEGRLWYPAQLPGEDTELSTYPGDYPLIVMMMGRSDTTDVHLGLERAADRLAAVGFVVASIKVDDLNTDIVLEAFSDLPDDFAEREGYLRAAVQFLIEGSGPSRLADVQSHLSGELGLLGHSRGGHAAALVAADCDNTNCGVVSTSLEVVGVLLLAPADGAGWTGGSSWARRTEVAQAPGLVDIPTFTIHGTADQDVRSMSGYVYHDKASGTDSAWFKSLFAVRHATHTGWNTLQPPVVDDKDPAVGPVLTADDHSAMLMWWSKAFFQVTTQSRLDWRRIFTFRGQVLQLEDRSDPANPIAPDVVRVAATADTTYFDRFQNFGPAENDLAMMVDLPMTMTTQVTEPLQTAQIATNQLLPPPPETTAKYGFFQWIDPSEYTSHVSSVAVDPTDFLVLRVARPNAQSIASSLISVGIETSSGRFTSKVSTLGGAPSGTRGSHVNRPDVLWRSLRVPLGCLRDSNGVAPDGSMNLNAFIVDTSVASITAKIAVDEVGLQSGD